jgi:hypothetical protein
MKNEVLRGLAFIVALCAAALCGCTQITPSGIDLRPLTALKISAGPDFLSRVQRELGGSDNPGDVGVLVVKAPNPDPERRIFRSIGLYREPFIRLLRSGSWSDHNKASLVLVALTTSRDPQVLAQLRTEVLDSLLEMGRWRSIGHAEAALTILGRMAGIDEDTLNKLIDAGQTATILRKFDR